MNHPVLAAKHPTHGPEPKPRAIVINRGRQCGRTARQRTSQQAEGLLLRTVARLSAISSTPAACAANGYFVNGYLAALVTHGVLTEARAQTISTACNALLDGHLTQGDLNTMKAAGSDTDPTYLRAVSLVRRAGHALAADLATQLQTTDVAARRLIERMQADGLVNEPDLFGTRTLKVAAEVRHG